jgi:hypothetical protein
MLGDGKRDSLRKNKDCSLIMMTVDGALNAVSLI